MNKNTYPTTKSNRVLSQHQHNNQASCVLLEHQLQEGQRQMDHGNRDRGSPGPPEVQASQENTNPRFSRKLCLSEIGSVVI